MSVELMGMALRSGLPLAPKMLLTVLCDFANRDGEQVYPSVATMAEQASMTPRGVQKHLAAFRAMGLLVATKPATPTAPAVYRIDVERLRALTSFRDEPRSPGEYGSPNPSERESSTLVEDTNTDGSGERRSGVNHVHPLPADFGEFWAAYPKRVARPLALRAWRTLKPTAELRAVMLDALERQKAGWRDPKFIPNPATWLNQRRWEDEVPDEALPWVDAQNLAAEAEANRRFMEGTL